MRLHAATLFVLGALASQAQTPNAPTEFEVASIKPSAPQPMGQTNSSQDLSGGRFTARSLTLKT